MRRQMHRPFEPEQNKIKIAVFLFGGPLFYIVKSSLFCIPQRPEKRDLLRVAAVIFVRRFQIEGEVS